MLDDMMTFHKVMFILVLVLMAFTFVFMILMMFSSKFRGKLLSKQIKSMKYMTDNSSGDLEKMMVNLNQATINSKKKILDENEETLKDISDRSADINKGAVKKYVKSIKEGLEDSIYCKHCGEMIDADSKYCKKCGGIQ